MFRYVQDQGNQDLINSDLRFFPSREQYTFPRSIVSSFTDCASASLLIQMLRSILMILLDRLLWNLVRKAHYWGP